MGYDSIDDIGLHSIWKDDYTNLAHNFLNFVRTGIINARIIARI
jgi:hypothetical protein